MALMMLVPVYIFLGRLPLKTFIPSTFHVAFTGQFWIDKILSFPIFLLLVPLIEFAGIPFFLLYYRKVMPPLEWRYFLACWPFFLLTYVIAYSGANNLSMRGMLLPTFVIFLLSAKTMGRLYTQKVQVYAFMKRRIFVTAVIVLTSIGTVKESAGKIYLALHNMRAYYAWVYQEDIPDYDIYLPPKFDEQIAQFIQQAPLAPLTKDKLLLRNKHKYDLERRITNLTLKDMERWEKELIRLPRRGFFY